MESSEHLWKSLLSIFLWQAYGKRFCKAILVEHMVKKF